MGSSRFVLALSNFAIQVGCWPIAGKAGRTIERVTALRAATGRRRDGFSVAGPGYRTDALAAAVAFGIAAVAAPDARAAEAGWADGRWYVGLNVPVMFIDDTESDTKGTQYLGQGSVPYKAKAKTEYNTGFKVAGVVGYELGGGFRVEAELFFARAEVGKLTYSGVNAAGTAIPGEVNIPISGTADQLGGFANVWYDIRAGTDWIPYIGGGLGFIRVDQSDLKYDSNGLPNALVKASNAQAPDLPPGTVPEISTTDTVFAYHVGVGMGYRLTDNVILQAGYRFQSASDLEFEGKNAAGNIKVGTGLRVHFLEVGVRYRF